MSPCPKNKKRTTCMYEGTIRCGETICTSVQMKGRSVHVKGSARDKIKTYAEAYRGGSRGW